MNDSSWDNAITALASQILNAPDDFSPEQNYPCPVCGNRLLIHMGRYRRYTTDMIGVTIECKECNTAIAIDSMEM